MANELSALAAFTCYRVIIATVVDRPELRGATFPAVKAGTRIVAMPQYEGMKAALAEYDACLRGEYDFASEYVAKVAVERRVLRADGSTFQTYTCRKPQRRNGRDGAWEVEW